jgi:hypothetical protein
MRSEDPRRLAAAVAVLVLALSLLGFQIHRHGRSAAPPPVSGAAAGASGAGGIDAAAVAPPAVPLPAGVDDVLRRNPFLRPASATSRGSGTSGGSGKAAAPPRAAPLRLTGTRTGSPSLAIIDDRVRRIGDSVQGWRIASIERDRVTLERLDGRTTDLVLR